MADRTLLLVDGSSYLYRAYHALPDLRGPGGVPTGAIRGVVSMMKLLREQYPAAHGACVFDDKGKTFRDDLYPEYTATRTARPDDLALQIEPIHEAVRLLGWPVLTVPGIEADDAICCARSSGIEVRVALYSGYQSSRKVLPLSSKTQAPCAAGYCSRSSFIIETTPRIAPVGTSPGPRRSGSA